MTERKLNIISTDLLNECKDASCIFS